MLLVSLRANELTAPEVCAHCAYESRLYAVIFLALSGPAVLPPEVRISTSKGSLDPCL